MIYNDAGQRASSGFPRQEDSLSCLSILSLNLMLTICTTPLLFFFFLAYGQFQGLFCLGLLHSRLYYSDLLFKQSYHFAWHLHRKNRISFGFCVFFSFSEFFYLSFFIFRVSVTSLLIGHFFLPSVVNGGFTAVLYFYG